jgi:Flp pilus assembly pilin Flp
MRNATNIWMRLRKEEKGQDLTEHALLLVVTVLTAIASMQSLAAQISGVFSTASGACLQQVRNGVDSDIRNGNWMFSGSWNPDCGFRG